MPEECCFKLKDTTTMAQGTISEPLAIGVYAVKQAGLKRGDTIGILGMGPIGNCVMLPAQAYGAGAIYTTDRIPARVTHALTQGATYCGNPDQSDIVADILEQEPGGLDIVFECAGQQETIDQAVRLLKPGGKLLMIGIPEFDRISFEIDRFRRQEITFINVRRQRGCVEEALRLIEDGIINVDPMVTHEFPFEKTQQAFDLVASYQDGIMKAMVNFS